MDQSKDDDSFKIIELIKNGNDIYIHIGNYSLALNYSCFCENECTRLKLRITYGSNEITALR